MLRNRLISWLSVYGSGKYLGESSKALQVQSLERAIKTFHRSRRIVPIYARILEKKGIDPKSVRSAEQFTKSVPVIDKDQVFGNCLIQDLVQSDLRTNKLGSLLVSSGTSGKFSFGLKYSAELKANAFKTDVALDTFYGSSRKNTLILNCLPMGSRVYSGISQAEVGPDSQRALAVIRQSKGVFLTRFL